MEHQHRDVAGADHRRCCAPEDKLPDRTVSIGTHHEQVDAIVLYCSGDHFLD